MSDSPNARIELTEFEANLLRTAVTLRVALMNKELARRRREGLLDDSDPAMAALIANIEEYSKLRERLP